MPQHKRSAFRIPARRAVPVAVLSVASALALYATLAAPSATAAPTVRSDFNGDGYADLAVGVPGGSADGIAKAGFVHILWGSANGLDGTATKISQASEGIPGTAEAADRFGFAVQAADFDDDGFADLAVTAPGEQVTDTSTTHEGAAYVLWGSAKGLKSGLTVAKGVDGQQLGRLLTAGDYDDDGDQDLVLTVAGEEGGSAMLRPGPLTKEQPLDLVEGYDFGDARALTSADFDGDGTDDLAATFQGTESSGTRVRTLVSGTWTTLWRTTDFGTALAAGDFDGDGRKDLAIGDVHANSEAESTYCEDRLGGAVATVYGAAGSTLGGKVTCTTQSSPEVGGTAESGDNFGASLAVADLGGSGDGLLAGASHEAVGSVAKAGAYWELRAGSDGVFTGPSFTQNSSGIAGTAEEGDLFGTALTSAPYDDAHHGDLVIGAPGENAGTGGVWYRPSAGDATRLAAVSFTPGKLDLSGAVAYGGVLGK
ncbi:FG-GAP-like repeat-containing protein [Streptomyces phyllanthi]|uniref:FG-GAP-like repeat-containing protein n=1 Tax=Streptomyces phyllanthi TaxID=1803180 RepID=UPI001883B1D1|nr:FG-GAP-like repeat-containing protein [Streptomyces phyllanthi]